MIMKSLKVLLSTLMLLVIVTSCTYAQKQTFTNKTYPIQSFTSVESDIVGNVIYTQSNVVSARAEGDKDLVDRLSITVKNDVLKINLVGKNKSNNKKKLTIFISSPFIDLIDIEGVGNWFMEGRVKANYLKIKFDGVGNFEALDLESANINADYEGVGNLLLGGTTDLIEIKSEGVGSINTQNLKAKRAIVESSGVGSVKCYASISIDLVNSGVGSITYYGDPKIKNIKNSGIGKIKAGK